ncbi:CRISPR-associated endonuclease Cas2 [Salinispora mooreana]|uniref:CRISPR-associated endonuclease Cas2 n=2 Tax=Salinispora mooreana TaxID=999545 RepID=UPI00053554F3|nr:CRISPR-associated endonuclease Cas2 [Salinispora mooreana]
MEPRIMEYLVTYDVDTTTPEGQRRLRQVAKICEGHGIRVQKSVFEIACTAAQYPTFRQKLSDTISHTTDDIRLYHLTKDTLRHVERLGVAQLAPHHGDHLL